MGRENPAPTNPMTEFDSKIHHRHSIRLKGYDYSEAGAYFVTIVTQGRAALFGEVVNGEMRLNRYGEIVQKWWEDIPQHFANVETGAFVIMPNHVHGIIIISDGRRGTVPVPQDEETPKTGGETPPLRKPTLGKVVAYFKYQSTKEINALRGGPAAKIWQRNYYEHILRNPSEMATIASYILSNPGHWLADPENNP